MSPMREVYFAHRESDGLIKIGCSVYPESRAKQLSSDLKTKVKIIGVAPGGFFEERSLHRRHAEHRIRGEWFSPSVAVLRTVDYVTKHGELPPLPKTDRDVLLKKLFLGGDTLQSIGSHLGLSRERVRQIAKELGLPARSAA